MRLNTQVKDLLSQHLQSFSIKPTLRVALSGGVDSCVLLASLVELQKSLDFNLEAMHVHHGLSPNADHWAEFCAKTCIGYGVPLEMVRVNVDKASGLGIEASARAARYQALLSGNVDYVVLAHHQDDQAETFLLQLLRGAGLKGLSAMAEVDLQRRLLRPLLNTSRQEIEHYAKVAQLDWIEDESNLDVDFDRNYCRHEILPIIQKRYPAANQTLARSAAHIAEASELLDDLASLDAQVGIESGCLNIEVLTALSVPRAKNLLRWWLASDGFPMPSKERLADMLTQLCQAQSDATMKITLGDAQIRRYQGMAYIEYKSGMSAQPIAMIWQGEAELIMPDGSRLLFERKQGQGLAIDRLGGHKLRIASRAGGEKFKPDLARPTRTLKYLLQEANVAPWLRERMPLIYLDDTLAVVPNVGVSCLMQAAEKEMGLVIRWGIDTKIKT